MKLPEEQLRETLKILTFEFVNSVQKMTSLHEKRLLSSKHELFSEILNMIQFQKNQYSLEDYFKMLQNSYDDEMKNQCFEKDLSLSVQNHQDPKVSQSDMENDEKYQRKDSFDDSTQKIKKEIHNTQRSTEVTKYNSDHHQIFHSIDSYSDECKKEETNSISKKMLDAQNQESISQISESDEMKQELNEESNQSLFEISENSESQKESYSLRGNAPNYVPRAISTKKKYRSYAQQQKQQSISYALQMGLQFTSRTLGIPKKNIARWMKREQKCGQIRGRKPGDPAMEQNLTNWIKDNIEKGVYITQTEIRAKARFFAGDKAFKASKGWLQKYFRRNSSIGQALNGLMYLRRFPASKVEDNKIM